jgi:hypothetical protein
MFRRVVTHLSAIQDQNQLHAEPLVYNRTWTIPADSVTAEGFQALQKEYLVTYSRKDNSYTLRKQITGQILITNYDPNMLSPDERARLIDETEEGQLNDVSFDIRSGHIGGEYPLKGDFRLRSFNTILNFLGRSLEEDPECNVDKDPRTPAVHENPVHTMELLLSDGAPSGADLSIQSHGKYYAVNTTGPLARWNREAFQMLYLLFQMTVSRCRASESPASRLRSDRATESPPLWSSATVTRYRCTDTKLHRDDRTRQPRRLYSSPQPRHHAEQLIP